MVLRDAVRSLFDGARRLHARLHHRQLNQSRPVARDLLALRCIGRRRLLERHRDSSRVSELAPRYWNYATFEPTFLYETCWNLLLFAALTWLWRTRRVRAPGLFWLYVAGYSGFRVFEETQWIDYSNYFLGMRVNFWIASLLCLFALTCFVLVQQRFRGWGPPAAEPAPPGTRYGPTPRKPTTTSGRSMLPDDGRPGACHGRRADRRSEAPAAATTGPQAATLSPRRAKPAVGMGILARESA
jgi:Prolipoprotein diacylglyceryl transferase